MMACDTRPVAKWLLSGARSASESDQALAETCERLRACGVPLWRTDIYVRTLHPDVVGRRFRWQLDKEVLISAATYDVSETTESRKSLIERVCAEGKLLRRRLADANCEKEFPLLLELLEEGATDLLATPLIFTDGDVHAVLWTTRQPGGFTDEQIAGIERIVEPLARVTEVRALRRTATNLLDTYVGKRTGQRILAGQIRRGHSEVINAAIWLSDMRGFTSLSDQLPPHVMIDLLNRYFDCQIPVILSNGGEVLNFMGDGLLAMFPIERPEDSAQICAQALAAAIETRAKVLPMPKLPAMENLPPVRFGLALHLGEVLYGNIGGGNRLDFTCIGPAVNLAARLEKIAAELERTIVTSEIFARHCEPHLSPLGQFTVRGLSTPQTVFGLLDEDQAGRLAAESKSN
jgi:adenylate cyclase